MAGKHKRNTRGLNYDPKLTWADVREIRSTYVYGSRKANLRVLAERYGVSLNTLHKVVTNASWRDPAYGDAIVKHPIFQKRKMRSYCEMSHAIYKRHLELRRLLDEHEKVQKVGNVRDA